MTVYLPAHFLSWYSSVGKQLLGKLSLFLLVLFRIDLQTVRCYHQEELSVCGSIALIF